MKKLFFYSFVFALLSGIVYAQPKRSFNLPPSFTKENYRAGVVIIKLKKAHSQNGRNTSAKPSLVSIEKELKSLNVSKTTNPFPDSESIQARSRSPKIDLSNIYFLEIPTDKNIEEAINILLQNDQIEYAEPYYNRSLFVTPNDPNASQTSSFQYQLKLVKAYQAWDIQRGDSNMVIGILDTGVLPTHPDLKGNLKYNYTDPINGVDDDSDGYIDNYLGWDFGDNDNDVTADKKGHGTEVAGCSNGFANNSIGVAGTSYNTKFMPLKMFNKMDLFFGGYEAILYAARHGVKVINLSWGGEGGSAFEQDIINKAVEDYDVVVIAAAGNTHGNIDFYPASYENVLSVAATNILDEKASFSTFSTHVDICAPGDKVGTTNNSGGYGLFSGTSYSSPIVAGAAALVRSKFPKYTARQVIEQLRVTADDIYSKAGNTQYFEKLGKGRLNMYRALTDTLSPSVRLTSFAIDNGFGSYAFYDDTVKIMCELKNYLRKASDLKVTLTSSSPYVTILKNTFRINSLSTFQITDNNESPFLIYLSKNTPDSTNIVLRFEFETNGYKDFQYVNFNTSQDYLNTTFNAITMTTSSNGRIGYKDDSRSSGIGLKVENQQYLGRGGIIFATNPLKVSSNVINNFGSGETDNSLTATRNIKLFRGSYADMETRGTMVDTVNNTNKIGLVISQKQYGWKEANLSKFVILDYYITNVSGASIPVLYSGLFSDFNIGQIFKNRADWDPVNNLGYVYSDGTASKMIGVTLLTSGEPSYFAMDNLLDNGGGIDPTDIFSREEKYNAIANGVSKTQAGLTGEGSDVSTILGVKIENLANKKSIKVAYAIVYGATLEELQSNAQKAKEKYNEYILNPPISITSLYCNNSPATIKRTSNASFNLYNELPLTTPVFTGTAYHSLPLARDTVFYVTNTDEGFESEASRVLVLKDDAVADLIMDVDTLDLLYGNKVTFTDNTAYSVQREWDFNNGYKSINRSTTRTYNKQGTYTIKLKVENRTGCKDSTEKKLVVVSTSPKPEVTPLFVCKNGNITITPLNGSNFKFYDRFPLASPAFTGNNYSLSNLTSSKTLWITCIDSTYESSPLEFKIHVWDRFARFDTSTDTINLDHSNSATVENTTPGTIALKWSLGDFDVVGVNKTSFSFHKTGIYPLTLEVMNLSGCTDTITKTIVVLRKSSAPVIQGLSICSGTSATILVSSGTKNRFYDSYLLGTPVFEGSSFITEKLVEDKSFYVTNIDSALESDPTEVKIKVAKNSSDFSTSKSILNLNETDTISFVGSGEDIVKWHWDFGNGKTDTVSSPIANFDSTGTYMIELTTRNSLGCQETVQKVLEVIKSEYALEKAINVYPNPAQSSFAIHTSMPEKEEVTVKLFNSSGKVVYQVTKVVGRGVFEVDGSNFPSGLYCLRLFTAKESVMRKVMFYK